RSSDLRPCVRARADGEGRHAGSSRPGAHQGRMAPAPPPRARAFPRARERTRLRAVAVPVDELALDHGKSDDGVIHARERLIHPRLIPRALCGDVDLRKLTVLVVISDVVVLHTHLPVAPDW